MNKLAPVHADIVRTPVEKLIFDLKVTAGSRFNAAARLNRREKSSTLLESVYAALLICVSIATFTLPLGSNIIRYASFGGIVAAILLLVMSTRKFGHRYGVEAEQMHRCALELNELKRRIQAMQPAQAAKKLSALMDEFSRIMQKWSVNHTQEDYLDYKYKHKWEFADIANVPDKELPDRRFQEFYSVTVGAVAFATVVGIAFILFLGSIIWSSISDFSEASSFDETSMSANPTLDNTLNALERAEQALANATEVLATGNQSATTQTDADQQANTR